MDPFSSKGAMNMDGSTDLYYRYKMPAICVKHEGKGKMKKSILINIKEVCESIGRPPDYLMTYLGQKLSAMSKVEKDIGLSYVTGHHDLGHVQEQVLCFIRDVVMCRKCGNPETTCHTEGSKKQQGLFLQCKGCGKRSDLDATNRFVKHMISHHVEEIHYGHASHTTNSTVTVEAAMKKECPKCHHKTSKSTCTKCGSQTADITLEDTAEAGPKRRECPNCSHKTSKPSCSKCGLQLEGCGAVLQESTAAVEVAQDLVGSLKLVMADLDGAQGGISLDGLLAHAKMEGFPCFARLDLLGAAVHVIAVTVSDPCAMGTRKLQPVTVAMEAKPVIAKWSVMLEQLSNEIPDARSVADFTIAKVQEGVAYALTAEAFSTNGDCMVVGLLLALKEVNGLADGLLEGCRRLPQQSAAMNKFIEFLAEEEDDEDEEVEDDERNEDRNEDADDDDDAGSGTHKAGPLACDGQE